MKLLYACALGCMTLQAQPYINYRGIVNAASFTPVGASGSGIAQGSIFSIFGSNLGPAGSVQVSSFPLPATLAGVSIKVTQGKVSVDALPLVVTPGQVNAIMPSNAPLGRVSIQLTFNGDASNPGTAIVIASSFGIFAVNSAGFGPGALLNFVTQNNQPPNSLAATAAPGQTITLFGTGLGAVPADNVAPSAGNLSTPVEVFVAGQPASVVYSGRSPCCSGLDQIVFTVPGNAPPGCYVPVQVRTNQANLSNSVTMAIQTDGTACSDPRNSIGTAFLKSGNLGVVVLARSQYYADVDRSTPSDVSADLAEVTLRAAPGGSFFFNPAISMPPLGACTTYTTAGAISAFSVPDLFGGLGMELDAGANVKILGTGSASIARAPASPLYSAVIGVNDPALGASSLVINSSGTTTVSTTGGAVVGPFQVNVPAAPALNWTNRPQMVSIDRSNALTVTWSPDGLRNSLVIVAGSNYDLPTNTQQSFACSAAGEAGSFSIPAYILQTFPASRPRVGQSSGIVMLGAFPEQNVVPFSASGLDTGLAVEVVSSSKTVLFR